MNALNLTERYLRAVAAQLPAAKREDIVAELRDSLHPNAPAPAGEPSERARPSTTPSSSSARPSDASGSTAPTSPASSPSATGGEAP